MRLVRRVRGTPLAFGLSAARRDSSLRGLNAMPGPPAPKGRTRLTARRAPTDCLRGPGPPRPDGLPLWPHPAVPQDPTLRPAPSPATHRESSRRIFHCPHTQV